MTETRAALNQAHQSRGLRRWTVGERVGEYAFVNYLGATERSEYLWFACVTCGGLRKVTRGNTKQLVNHGCPVCRSNRANLP